MQEFGSVVARVKAEWVVVSGVARAKSTMYKSVAKGRGEGEIEKRVTYPDRCRTI